jgi:chloramphenicol 3-O phosphotransferase
MSTQVIVLNGGSSAGKSGIARCLQVLLPKPWITLGVDTLLAAMPASMRTSDARIEFAADGSISVGAEFRTLDIAWSHGIAAMARAGARIIVDEIFLGGATSRARLKTALEGLEVLWVGVHCDAGTAEGREMARGDRLTGMARSQASIVHVGVTYDLTVDTSQTESLECAQTIAAHVT